MPSRDRATSSAESHSDAPLDVTAVAEYLGSLGLTIEGPLVAQLIAGGRSNLTYVLRDATHSWVVRRPPLGHSAPSAHDMAREHRVTKALAGTGIPVAKALGFCEDRSVIGAPFSVVEFVKGRSVGSQEDLAVYSDHDVELCFKGLVGTLARLHAVDHVAVGLESYGRPDDYASRQIRTWSRQWDLTTNQPPGRAELLRDLLAMNSPLQERVSIVHGDYRIDNTLIDLDDPSRIAAVVDWELSTIGDPIADVALMAAYRHPAFNLIVGTQAAWTSSRLPSGDQIATAYEASSGIVVDHWEFHLGLAYYKLAAMAQGIDYRFRTGATVGDGFDTAGDAVPDLIEAGIDAVRSI